MNREDIEEIVKSYIKENLRIEINSSSGYYGEEYYDIKLYLNDDMISSDSLTVSHGSY